MLITDSLVAGCSEFDECLFLYNYTMADTNLSSCPVSEAPVNEPEQDDEGGGGGGLGLTQERFANVCSSCYHLFFE